MALAIRKAQRRKAKLRLALLGPSGSGKTMSALKLAFGIGGKVGVIDTENGSADLYADLGDYDVITLDKPYTVQKYREAISAFEREGYSTIIVDSLTHAWAGAGGLLDKHGQLSARPGANSYAAWRDVTPDHNALVETMLSSPCHIVATMRVKTEYVLEEDARGKKVPRKVGLQPVQRDGLEYEFTVVMDVDMNHKASAAKDRTTIFDGWYDTISEATGRKLLDWLESGGEALPPKPPEPVGPLAAMQASPDEALTIFDSDGVEHVIRASKMNPAIYIWMGAARKAIGKLESAGAVREWRATMGPYLAEMSATYPEPVAAVEKLCADRIDAMTAPEPAEEEAASDA